MEMLKSYIFIALFSMPALCQSADEVIVSDPSEIPMCVIRDMRISVDITDDKAEKDLLIRVRTLRPNKFRNDDALLDSDFTIIIIDSNDIPRHAIMADEVQIVPEGGGIALHGWIHFRISKEMVPDKAHVKFLKIGYQGDEVQVLPRNAAPHRSASGASP